MTTPKPANQRPWMLLTAIGAVTSIVAILLMASFAQKLQQTHTYQGKKVRYTYRSGALMLAFTKDRVQRVMQDWKRPITPQLNGITINQKILWPGDFIFPFGYGFLFLGLLVLLSYGLPDPLARWGAWLRWMPLLAALLDFGENTLLLQMLSMGQSGSLHSLAGWIPAVSGTISILKYTFASVLTPLWGLYLLAFYWKSRPVHHWKSVLFALFALLCFSSSFAFLVRTLMGLQ